MNATRIVALHWLCPLPTSDHATATIVQDVATRAILRLAKKGCTKFKTTDFIGSPHPLCVEGTIEHREHFTDDEEQIVVTIEHAYFGYERPIKPKHIGPITIDITEAVADIFEDLIAELEAARKTSN